MGGLNNNFQGHMGPRARCLLGVQKSSSRPALSHVEGKAAASFARRASFHYVSTENWRPACAKPLRRRQGTPLAAFFNRPNTTVPPGITPGGTVPANFVYAGVGRQSYWNHEIRIPGSLPTNKFKPTFPLFC